MPLCALCVFQNHKLASLSDLSLDLSKYHAPPNNARVSFMSLTLALQTIADKITVQRIVTKKAAIPNRLSIPVISVYMKKKIMWV